MKDKDVIAINRHILGRKNYLWQFYVTLLLTAKHGRENKSEQEAT